MPFAGYKDFDSCVASNQDKRDPEAYCATIMRRVEGEAGVSSDTDPVAKKAIKKLGRHLNNSVKV